MPLGLITFYCKCVRQKEVLYNWIYPVLSPDFHVKYACSLLNSQDILSPSTILDSYTMKPEPAGISPPHFPSDRRPSSCSHFLNDDPFCLADFAFQLDFSLAAGSFQGVLTAWD